MFDPKKYVISMRGKDYLEVKWRLVWFRDAHPNGSILTTLESSDPLIMKATISVPDIGVVATGYGSANVPDDGRRVVWTGREIEKAETAAIGRALAHAGFGTQFTDEDETRGGHLADAPVEQRPEPAKNGKRPYGPAVLPEKLRDMAGRSAMIDRGEPNKKAVGRCAALITACLPDDAGEDERHMFQSKLWGVASLNELEPPQLWATLFWLDGGRINGNNYTPDETACKEAQMFWHSLL